VVRCEFKFAVSVALLAIAVLYGAGCSTNQPPAESRQINLPQAQKPPATADRSISTGASKGSSLEQLQQGTPVGTAASSPLQDIYFDFDSYDLRAEARDALKRNGEWLEKNPSSTVQIEGHCDERGTGEYNIALGAKRAQAAKDYLASLGISAQRLSTISYGEELPVCNAHREDCWRKNRHDRFVIKTGPTS
jgi:peptidoglycan-associated lipoprotein